MTPIAGYQCDARGAGLARGFEMNDRWARFCDHLNYPPIQMSNFQMSNFFETDTDEYEFQGKTYVNYFNLYSNLWFKPTLEHIQSLEFVTIVDTAETTEGWQIAVTFCDHAFLLDTHFHGTSTMFCVEKGVSDRMVMLAFLGCFLPTIRDDWPNSDNIPSKQTNWLSWLRPHRRSHGG